MNVVMAWCTWTGMKIRPDKCQVFAMRKQNNEYKQYMPVIVASDSRLPAVEFGKSFCYLGKLFNSNMNTEEAKKLLEDKLNNILVRLPEIPTSPQMKLKILKLFVYPRISFELKTYNFSASWIGRVLDGMVHTHIRR